MRRRYRRVAVLMACSLTLTLLGGWEGRAARAADGGVEADADTESGTETGDGADTGGGGTETGDGADTGGSGTETGDPEETVETFTDAATGYTYVLYEEKDTSVKKAEITGYTGSGTELTIPAKVGEYDVESIGTAAFKGNGDITSVVISEGICRIRFEAFMGCSKLAKVTVPSTVTDWDDAVPHNRDEDGDRRKSKAFQGCVALKEINLSQGLTVLGDAAFYGCTSLESVTVPGSVEKFHSEVFEGCTSLKRVELQEGIRMMGYQAFGECTALEEVVIPSTIEQWDTPRNYSTPIMMHYCESFRGCTSLKRVTFAEGLKTLKFFSGVKDCPLVTEIDIPASVRDVEWAFDECTYLKKITMHDGMETIGTRAFTSCSALEEIRLPDTVTRIEEYAFQYCTSLRRLVLPTSLTTMTGTLITSGCTNLKELYLLSESVAYAVKLDVAEDGKLYCPEGSDTYNKYRASMSDSSKLAKIPGTGVEIQRSIYYTGQAQDGVVLTGTQEGDEILYRLDDGEWQRENPQVTEVGSYNVEVIVKRLQTENPQYSRLSAQVRVIKKRQYTMRISDLETKEGEDYTIAVEGYRGSGEPVFTYYSDEACQSPLSGKPESAGVYYVRASVAEMEAESAVESNVAKLTILPKEQTGTDPEPSTEPGTEPTQKPEDNSGDGTTPTRKPEDNSGGGTTPTQKPDDAPGDSTAPTQKPGGNVGASPTPTQNPGKVETPKVKKVTLQKVKSTKKKTLQIQWKKVSKASGYQVQLATNQKFTKGKKSYLVTKGKTTKKTIKKLKRKKKYYVRVRAYQTYQGKKVYGGWSKTKKAKVK